MTRMSNDWRVFKGNNEPHDELDEFVKLDPPPWRRFDGQVIDSENRKPEEDALSEKLKRYGQAFRIDDEARRMVNAALYLRRPLLITGDPGTGKSSLIYAVAYELKLGEVLEWPITSRSTLPQGLYSYDPIARLHDKQINRGLPEIGDYLRLGPLGTALLPSTRPRALLIDEIDKSDLDLPNDLLNIFETGEYRIPELERIKKKQPEVPISDAHDRKVTIPGGHVKCLQFPFVVMTSNGEREFPAPFLRRCLQLRMPKPDEVKLAEIVRSHLKMEVTAEVESLIRKFVDDGSDRTLATDQLLNAVHLVCGRTLDESERQALIEALFTPLN
jgi:MoxR-like ATPase